MKSWREATPLSEAVMVKRPPKASAVSSLLSPL
jgi:hypothetical protein